MVCTGSCFRSTAARMRVDRIGRVKAIDPQSLHGSFLDGFGTASSVCATWWTFPILHGNGSRAPRASDRIRLFRGSLNHPPKSLRTGTAHRPSDAPPRSIGWLRMAAGMGCRSNIPFVDAVPPPDVVVRNPVSVGN
eukprot:scaffold660_cov365-Pavlova_lutheri.AAC.4